MADLLVFVGLQQFLADKLGCKIDVVPQRSLRDELRASVFNEMVSL